MGGAEPTPETTLAVILGASQFKDPNFTPSKAFEKSAQDFRAYLLDPKGLGLPFENLLYLFDLPDEATQLDDMFVDFLRSRVTQESERPKPRDLIFFYVGHGAFSSPGDEYFLAVRATRSPNRFQTGYSVAMLANTLKECATHLRRYLILDSCFSAAAYAAFQSSGPLEVAKQKTLAEFPGKGTGLLCAAGPRDPAKVLPGQVHTMFSGAFLEVLRKGSLELDEKLSLLQLGDLTLNLIRDRFPDDAVRPEAHAPDMRQGSLVQLPFFPNAARREIEWRQHVSRLDEAISTLKKRQAELEEIQQQFQISLTAHQGKISELTTQNKNVGQHQEELEKSLKKSLDEAISGLKIKSDQHEMSWQELVNTVGDPRLVPTITDQQGNTDAVLKYYAGWSWLAASVAICFFALAQLFIFYRPPAPQIATAALEFMTVLSCCLAVSCWLPSAWSNIAVLSHMRQFMSGIVGPGTDGTIRFFHSIIVPAHHFALATLFYAVTLFCLLAALPYKNAEVKKTEPSATPLLSQGFGPSATPAPSQNEAISPHGTVTISEGKFCDLRRGLQLEAAEASEKGSITWMSTDSKGNVVSSLFPSRHAGLLYAADAFDTTLDSVTKSEVEREKYAEGQISLDKILVESTRLLPKQIYFYSLGNNLYGAFRVDGIDSSLTISYVNFIP
jgi:uncharacterized caspase-like protein